MQADKAERLRRQWIAKGSPPCEHAHLDKEYMEGMDTGDKVCITCGESFAPSELKQDPKTGDWRPKSN